MKIYILPDFSIQMILYCGWSNRTDLVPFLISMPEPPHSCPEICEQVYKIINIMVQKWKN
jgi:hypothetical protein